MINMSKRCLLILTALIVINSVITKSQVPKCPARIINDLCRAPAREQSNITTTTDLIAPDGYYPWYAAIYHKEPTKLVFRCAGSIIHRKVILTSQRCFIASHNNKIPNNQLMVQVGSNKKYIGGQFFDVNFKTQNLQHLGLIFLTKSIRFNDYTRPVCFHINNVKDVFNSEHWVSNKRVKN